MTYEKRALLSVSDKAGVAELATALHELGFELVSTGGTARALQAAGLGVTPVSDVTRFPEMLDGRVKTLHPAIHGGILARRHRPDDLAALAAHAIAPIDVVVVNLYPFARAAADPATAFPDLVEEIDIGGPSLVRAAAKNFADVLVLVDPADYEAALVALRTEGGPTAAFRFELARKAFAHTAAYDATIAATLAGVSVADGAFTRPAPDRAALPTVIARQWNKIRDLRYGENPQQRAAWYAPAIEPVSSNAGSGFSRIVTRTGNAGLGAATVIQGKELSYTNLLDLDAAARIVLEFSEPAAVVIKHTNPCGAATADTIAQAYVTAREADALSAFGGIVGLNRGIDEETARAITATFIEAVIAPSVDPAARSILAAKANLRVVLADFRAFDGSDGADLEFRSILGALLVQERDRVLEAREAWVADGGAAGLTSAVAGGQPTGDAGAPPAGDRGGQARFSVVTRRAPTPDEWTAMRFAWRICAHVKSNTVIFTGPDRTLAIGAGQMSRVDSVKVAVMKATGPLRGSVAASDAFFPFRDGLDAVAAAGATAIVQPGGSVRDAEVIAAADEHGLAIVFTGRRHFRH
jgi:phosphoribosylaminoimidazolecarboxamide formyltransferase/IMP cyclohydrolase